MIRVHLRGCWCPFSWGVLVHVLVRVLVLVLVPILLLLLLLERRFVWACWCWCWSLAKPDDVILFFRTFFLQNVRLLMTVFILASLQMCLGKGINPNPWLWGGGSLLAGWGVGGLRPGDGADGRVVAFQVVVVG